jgi:hypothetical protein
MILSILLPNLLRGLPAAFLLMFTSYIDNVKADSGLQLYEVIHQSRDRDRRRPVVERSGAPTDGHGHGDR